MGVNNSEVSNFLDSVPRGQFTWGTFDCATFLAMCLKFLTGFDYSPIIDGKWKNKRQALKFFSKLTFLDFILDELEYREQTAQSCKSGDLCIFTCGKMHTVGMVFDDQVACVVENIGLTYSYMTEISEDIIKIVRISNG